MAALANRPCCSHPASPRRNACDARTPSTNVGFQVGSNCFMPVPYCYQVFVRVQSSPIVHSLEPNTWCLFQSCTLFHKRIHNTQSSHRTAPTTPTTQPTTSSNQPPNNPNKPPPTAAPPRGGCTGRAGDQTPRAPCAGTPHAPHQWRRIMRAGLWGTAVHVGCQRQYTCVVRGSTHRC